MPEPLTCPLPILRLHDHDDQDIPSIETCGAEVLQMVDKLTSISSAGEQIETATSWQVGCAKGHVLFIPDDDLYSAEGAPEAVSGSVVAAAIDTIGHA